MWAWKVRSDRPRIWLDESRLAFIRNKVKGKSVEEIKTLSGVSAEGQALAYVLTGDQPTGRAAVATMLSDAERFNWLYLLPVAVVYDWCRAVLTPEEEARIRETLVRECLQRIANRRQWRSFYHGLYMHSADVGAAAIALHGEDPFAQYGLEFIKSRYRDAMKMLDSLLPDGEWPEGCDYNRVSTQCAMRFLWAIKTATGDDLMAGSTHIRNNPYFVMYCAKPNGLVYAGGDNDYPYVFERDREAMLLHAAEFGDPHVQHFINHCTARSFLPTRYSRWRDLLWHDPSIPETPPDDLPRSRIFRGAGLVIARSGWGWDETSRRLPVSWVSFRCGPFMGQHMHQDNNGFEIYYRGELAIDSGVHKEDWWMERRPNEIKHSHLFNYYKRTIAHNSILVYDSSEVMEMGVANDGGQKEPLYLGGVRNDPENYEASTPSIEEKRLALDWVGNPGRWDMGSITAYTANEFFTYVYGDATKAYSAQKMELFVRHFLYLPPDLVVVFDKVVSTNPASMKTWVLHTIMEPVMHDGDAFEASYAGGRLACVPLLPEERIARKVGGPGREFLVGDVNYPYDTDTGHRKSRPLHFGETPGAWRMEYSPALPSCDDLFLNVILLTDKGQRAFPEARYELSATDALLTLHVSIPSGRQITAMFPSDGSAGARVVIRERETTVFEGIAPAAVIAEGQDGTGLVG